MSSDADLVAAVLAGQRAAYATLVDRYERAVQAAAMAILRHHHAAQDVAQEAFVIAYRKLGRLRNGAAFGGWEIRIARREALRAARRRHETSAPLESLPAPQRRTRPGTTLRRKCPSTTLPRDAGWSWAGAFPLTFRGSASTGPSSKRCASAACSGPRSPGPAASYLVFTPSSTASCWASCRCSRSAGSVWRA